MLRLRLSKNTFFPNDSTPPWISDMRVLDASHATSDLPGVIRLRQIEFKCVWKNHAHFVDTVQTRPERFIVTGVNESCTSGTTRISGLHLKAVT